MRVRPVLVACLGNGRRGDDAAALLVARDLEGTLPDAVELLALDDRAGALLGELDGRSALVVVDAIRCAAPADMPPGSLLDLHCDDGRLPAGLRPSPVSSHGWSIESELELGRRLELLPRVVRVLGVAIAAAAPHAPISAPVRSALPALARMVSRCAAALADRFPPTDATTAATLPRRG